MMGKVEKRQSKILELLSEKKKLDVDQLSSELHMSSVTIRKDLSTLESQKFLKRERGYAVLNTDSPIASRLTLHYSAKRRIVEKAASLVHSGDTVMIESGSSCVLLARELLLSGKQITIITNSVFMMNYASISEQVHFILCGGDYLPSSECLTGPLASHSIETYHANLFFSGTDGFQKDEGFTGDSLQKAEVLRTMADRSDRTIVLAESQKFSRTGTIALFPSETVDTVITDAAPDTAFLQALADLGIGVVIAPAV